MSALLGVDLGSKRIGLAVATATVATPLDVIQRTEDQADAARIAAIAREHGAELVVVGHPLRLDGTAGPAAEAAERFAATLRDSGIEVVLHDERLTTKTVERTLIDAGTSRARRREVVDKLAAAVILQGYLDSR